jgi:hypothetical protein
VADSCLCARFRGRSAQSLVKGTAGLASDPRLLRLRAVTFAALIAGRLLGGLSFCRCNPAALGIDLSGVSGHSEDVAMHHVIRDERRILE